jgi:hypothetical protein
LVGPGFAAVELADEGEQAVGGGVDVGGELGDLGLEGVGVGGEDRVGGGGHEGLLFKVGGRLIVYCITIQ